MALDREVVSAIQEAVEEADQPPAVAARLIAWLEARGGGELSSEDEGRFLDNVRSAIVLAEGRDEG